MIAKQMVETLSNKSEKQTQDVSGLCGRTVYTTTKQGLMFYVLKTQ